MERTEEMPKTVYVCDFCEKRYVCEAQAIDCEAQHIQQTVKTVSMHGLEILAILPSVGLKQVADLFVQNSAGDVHHYIHKSTQYAPKGNTLEDVLND